MVIKQKPVIKRTWQFLSKSTVSFILPETKNKCPVFGKKKKVKKSWSNDHRTQQTAVNAGELLSTQNADVIGSYQGGGASH